MTDLTPDREVTKEDVIVSDLIPNLDPMFLVYIGKGWWKDGVTGVCYHLIKDEDEMVSIKATRQSISNIRTKEPKPPKVKTPQEPKVEVITPPKEPQQPKEPKVHRPKRITIKCVDCGGEREINIQDAFQVKRCVDCQKKHTNVQRALRNKQRKLASIPQANG